MGDHESVRGALRAVAVYVAFVVYGLGLSVAVSAQDVTVPPPTITPVPSCTPFPIDALVGPLETIAAEVGAVGTVAAAGGLVQETAVADAGVLATAVAEVPTVAYVSLEGLRALNSVTINGVIVLVCVLVAVVALVVVGLVC